MRIEKTSEKDTRLVGLSPGQLPSFVTKLNSETRKMVFETQALKFKDKEYHIYVKGTMTTDYPQYGTFIVEWDSPATLEILGIDNSLTNTPPIFDPFPD